MQETWKLYSMSLDFMNGGQPQHHSLRYKAYHVASTMLFILISVWYYSESCNRVMQSCLTQEFKFYYSKYTNS